MAKVAILGAGTVGRSWATRFLAHGCRVRVFDPRSNEPEVRQFVRENVANVFGGGGGACAAGESLGTLLMGR